MTASASANPNQAGDKINSLLQDILAGKVILRAEMGLTNTDLEALYSVAYNMYGAGKYQDSVRMFGILGLLDPMDYRFIFGAASSAHMLGQYVLAAMQYQLAAAMDSENPTPMLHTAECLLAVKDKAGAKRALEYTMERSQGKDEYATLRARAEAILENLTA
jgi:type III secretion system low calcium response chaperone LcrH/SycD